MLSVPTSPCGLDAVGYVPVKQCNGFRSKNAKSYSAQDMFHEAELIKEHGDIDLSNPPSRS
jgi:hypothetical protein